MCCFVSTFTHDRDCKNNNLFFMHLFLSYFSQKKEGTMYMAAQNIVSMIQSIQSQ